jgi:hypothetical protein
MDQSTAKQPTENGQTGLVGTMAGSAGACKCGQKAGPTGLCADCFLGLDTRQGSLMRPKRRDHWIRGFVCAVAKHWEMTEEPNTDELLRLAGKVENILKHADEEDIETLRDAGLLPPNT